MPSIKHKKYSSLHPEYLPLRHPERSEGSDRYMALFLKDLKVVNDFNDLKKTKNPLPIWQRIFWSGYQDSNLGPSAPKADALTGLRYTPNRFATAKVDKKSIIPNFLAFFIGNISSCHCRNFVSGDVKNRLFIWLSKTFLLHLLY